MIYDFSTKNESFLNMHILLKRMGIENNKFHLILFNERLAGIDFFNENLPMDVKLMISYELATNFWFFYREILRIQGAGGVDKFILNPAALSTLYLMWKNRNFIIIQSRQTGKTFIVNAETGRVYNFVDGNITIGMISIKSDNITEAIGDIRDMLNLLPSYLRYHNKEEDKNGRIRDRSRLGTSTVKKLENKVNGNLIQPFIVSQSREQAKTTGRGFSLHILQIDEISFIKNNQEMLGSVIPATSTVMESARLKGIPHGIRMMTTPDISSKHGRFIEDKVQNKCIPWDLYMLDMPDNEMDIMIERNLKEKGEASFRIEYDYKEMGYSDYWFIKKTEGLTNDQIKQDILLKRTESSTLSPFKKATLEAMRSKLESVISYDDIRFLWNPKNEDEEIASPLSFTVYPEDGQVVNNTTTLNDFLLNFKEDGLSIGVDSAHGTENDNTSITFFNARTTKLVAELYSDTIDSNETAMFINKLITDVIDPNGIPCVINPEATGVGLSLTQRLAKWKHVERYLMIFPKNINSLYVDNDKLLREFRIGGEIGTYSYGFKTTGSSRDELIGIMLEAVNIRHEAILSENIYREACNLIETKAGAKSKIMAAPGEHDDALISVALGLIPIIKYPGILKEKFGIEVNPHNWIITEGAEVINPNVSYSSRIKTQLINVNGIIMKEYYDSKTGILLNEETAMEIIRKEQERSDDIITSGTIDSEKEIDQIVEDNKHKKASGTYVDGERNDTLNNDDIFNMDHWNTYDDQMMATDDYNDFWSTPF